MAKLMLILGIFMFSVNAYCEVSVRISCFTSGDKKPVRFMLEQYDDHDNQSKWGGAFVKYEHSKAMIPLVLSGRKEKPASEGKPSEETTDWLEVVNGKINGYYEMSSQGANINSIIYKNKITGKKHDFSIDPDIDFSIVKGCVWK